MKSINDQRLNIQVFSTKKDFKQFLKTKKIPVLNERSYIRFYAFHRNQFKKADYLEIRARAAKIKKLHIYHYEDGKLEKLEDIQMIQLGDRVGVSFKSHFYRKLLIEIHWEGLKKHTKVDFSFFNSKNGLRPFYSHFKSNVFKLDKEQKYSFQLEYKNTALPVIFYRSAVQKNQLSKTSWHAKNSIPETFVPDKDAYYEFMVVFGTAHPLALVSMPTVL